MYQALCWDMAEGKKKTKISALMELTFRQWRHNTQDNLVGHVYCVRVATGALDQTEAGQGNTEC